MGMLLNSLRTPRLARRDGSTAAAWRRYAAAARTKRPNAGSARWRHECCRHCDPARPARAAAPPAPAAAEIPPWPAGVAQPSPAPAAPAPAVRVVAPAGGCRAPPRSRPPPRPGPRRVPVVPGAIAGAMRSHTCAGGRRCCGLFSHMNLTCSPAAGSAWRCSDRIPALPLERKTFTRIELCLRRIAWPQSSCVGLDGLAGWMPARAVEQTWQRHPSQRPEQADRGGQRVWRGERALMPCSWWSAVARYNGRLFRLPMQ